MEFDQNARQVLDQVKVVLMMYLLCYSATIFVDFKGAFDFVLVSPKILRLINMLYSQTTIQIRAFDGLSR